jgi:hypothetical protein
MNYTGASEYDSGFSVSSGVFIEENYSTKTKKYFTDSVHIFAVG